MRFIRAIWTRKYEKKERTRKRVRIILFCKTTRKESSIYLPVRSREAFIRRSDRTNIRRKQTQEEILECSSDGRKREREEAAYLKSTGSWSRKPVSRSLSPFSVVAPPPLIPNLYKSTFRLHGFQNRSRAASRYVSRRKEMRIYPSRCRTATGECAANTLLDLEIGANVTRC